MSFNNIIHFYILGLTNMRGKDIEYNPLFFSYAVLFKSYDKPDIGSDATKAYRLILYGSKDKFDSESIKSFFAENNITLKNYELYDKEIAAYDETLLCDKFSMNQKTFEFLSQNKPNSFFLLKNDPVQYSKSIKNQSEIKSLQEANKKDAVCLIRFYSWLEQRLLEAELHKNNSNNLTELIFPPTEYECVLKLIEFRKKGEYYQGESFAAISASGENGAIIHYKPNEADCARVNLNEIYLLDSGAQYL